MYRKPNQYYGLRQYCRNRWSLAAAQANLLVDVELGLMLIQEIGLGDEPVSVLWVVLSGLALPDVRLARLSSSQRRAIANARVILADYGSRFAWARDLRDYVALPDTARQYNFDPDHLDTQIINAAWREGWDAHRADELRACLYAQLDFSSRGSRFPEAPGRYSFLTSNGRLTAYLSRADLDATAVPISWFSLQIRQRAPIRITWADLEDTARFLDEQETSRRWQERLSKVCFRPVRPDGFLGSEKADIVLDGAAHWAGIVGAGKSTVTILIAALGIRRAQQYGHEVGWRTLLTQQETQSALALAHQFNRWFGRDADRDPAVATTLLGFSSRAQHAAALYASRSYHEAVGQGVTHWGERLLESACPLQATILPGDLENTKYKPIPIGEEPCGGLIEQVPERQQNPRKFLCPFFAVCPSQQRFRDMTDALVWITTPGALGQASIPLQLDDRPVRISEIVYEQCDVVVLDEVDTVQEWFDRLYARETILVMQEQGGLLQRLDTRVTEYLNESPDLDDPDTLQWVEAVRHARMVAQKILLLLHREAGYPELAQWISRGHFTAMNLFVKLAHRLCGLKEYADPGDHMSQELLDELTRLFSVLQSEDPLNIPEPRSDADTVAFDTALYQLGQIAKNIMGLGTSRQDPNREQECVRWIYGVVPDVEERLQGLRANISQGSSPPEVEVIPDTIQTLARRLEFALCAALLDRQTRIVFYQRHRIHPDFANDESLFYRGIPRTLLDILPIPPTGRSFGIYYSHPPEDRHGQSSSLLSTYGYTNIGRVYVSDFNSLRCDIEGRQGPHVLAMSGTSFLPGSTQWHYDIPLSGVLEATPEARRALADSTFAFAPCEHKGEPIFVSGRPDKRLQLQRMARALLEGDRVTGGRLGRELLKLKQLGDEHPADWLDRERLLLLVNSYDQAEWVAKELQRQWTPKAEQIMHMVRQLNNRDTDDEWFADTVILRSDIERIGELETQIVVAPLQAIGRALNILNRYDKAAFGSVYFMTRPMPYPEGVQVIAQEINSRTLEWIHNADDPLWEVDGLYQRGLNLRQRAFELWRSIEDRTTYARLNADERHDLAMTTVGRLIQAIGRVLRGDVPFRAYFLDAAWAPERALKGGLDTARTSLLAAMIDSLSQCVGESQTGKILYSAILARLEATDNFDWTIEW